jgi:hypothetical protein
VWGGARAGPGDCASACCGRGADKMEVTLVRGAELNKATRTYDYSHYGNFGVLFFGPGQAAVIELENLIIGCPLEFTTTCLPRIGNLTGEDQDGTRWEICTQRYCY